MTPDTLTHMVNYKSLLNMEVIVGKGLVEPLDVRDCPVATS